MAYDENVPAAVSVIRKAIENCETVGLDREIQCFPCEFNASSVDIELTRWMMLWTEPQPYRTLTFEEPLASLFGQS